MHRYFDSACREVPQNFLLIFLSHFLTRLAAFITAGSLPRIPD